MGNIEWNKYMLENNRQSAKPTTNYPRQKEAEDLAKLGRHGDSMLVHMNPKEVERLYEQGGITINPETGQPEAFLQFLIPVIAAIGAGVAAVGSGVAAGAAVLGTAAAAVGAAGGAVVGAIGSGLAAAGTAIGGIFGGGAAAAAGTAAGTTAAGTAAAVPTVAGLTAAQASAAAPAIAAQVASAGSGLIATGSAPLAAAGSGVLLPGATTAAGLAGPSLAASAIPTIGGAGVMPLGYTNLAGQFVQGAAPEVMMSSYGAVPLTGGQALTPQALQGLASTPSTLGGSAGSTSSMLANTSVPNALQGSMSTGTFNSATTGLTQAEASALSNAANTGGALVPNAPAATTPQLSLGMKSVSPQLMSNEAGSIMMEGLSSGESGLGGMAELVKDNKMLTAMLMYGIGSELLGDEEDLEEERPPYVNTYTEKGLKGLNVYGENPVAGLNRRKRRGPGFNQSPRVGRSGGIT